MARVLVVDDTESSLDLVGQLLHMRGHEALFARSGVEAVDLAREATPDLILMDLQMPGMNGYEALAAITQERGKDGCPILALTAFGAVGEREKALAAGFDGFFSKPIAITTFMDQLEAFLGEDQTPAV